jgi:hypothetical protein
MHIYMTLFGYGGSYLVNGVSYDTARIKYGHRYRDDLGDSGIHGNELRA